MLKFRQIYNTNIVQGYCQNLVSAQYLVNVYALTLTRLGLLHISFCKLYNRVMVLDYQQNFVSSQHLENEMMELDQILHMH